MAPRSTAPGEAGALNDAQPLREQPVAQTVWRFSSDSAGKVGRCRGDRRGEIYHLGNQFTRDDRVRLAAWAGDANHGYDRVEVEQALLEDASLAGYALIYQRGQTWSTWGLTRKGGHLEVWRCATGKTVARHATMATALVCLPHAADHQRALPQMAVDDVVDQPCRNANGRSA